MLYKVILETREAAERGGGGGGEEEEEERNDDSNDSGHSSSDLSSLMSSTPLFRIDGFPPIPDDSGRSW